MGSAAARRGLLSNAARSYRPGALSLQPVPSAQTLQYPPVPAQRPAASASAAAPDAGSAELNAEQALALVGMSLMQKLAASGELPWIWSEAEDGGSCDVAALKQRLELTQLALQTGAPLSTAEVTYLMGARPGAADVERGGLRARRLSRNVWKLSEARGSERRGEVTAFSSFNDGRRRFA